MNSPVTFLPPGNAAARLGVPEKWLLGEIEAGRLPVLRAGRRTLVPLEAVARELERRAVALVGPRPVPEGP